MKKFILGVLVLFGMTTQAQNLEVQQTIETFFKGFHSRDSLAIQKVCSDKMGLQSIAESAKGSQFTTDSAAKFYQSIASIPMTMQFEERLLGHTIHVDGTMAIDWTPYEFYVNGKKSHSGVNVFTLYKDNGQWKIVAIIDTRRK
jgi:Putative lumazine-binding